MNQQKGGITRSTSSNATEERLRQQIIFWEEMAKVHNEAVLASIRSYFLGMIADDV